MGKSGHSSRRKADEDFSDYAGARWTVLVRSAYLLGCSSSDAEDAAQAALLQAYRYWGKVSAAASPDAYVHRILVNEVRRQRKRSREVPVDEMTGPSRAPHHPAHDWAQQIDVKRLLAQLSDGQRAVLVLRFFNDLSVDQVAHVLDVSPGTVKSRTSRALKELKGSQPQDETKDSYGRP